MLSDVTWREIARSLKLSPRELQIVRATFRDRKELAVAADWASRRGPSTRISNSATHWSQIVLLAH
jgi:hypothetical protein